MPAKYTPGSVVLSHHGVISGSRLRPLIETADLWQVEERRHEPGRRDDVIDLDGNVAARVGPPQADGQGAVAALGPLDPVEGSIEDRDAAAKDEILVGLDVAGTDARE